MIQEEFFLFSINRGPNVFVNDVQGHQELLAEDVQDTVAANESDEMDVAWLNGQLVWDFKVL